MHTRASSKNLNFELCKLRIDQRRNALSHFQIDHIAISASGKKRKSNAHAFLEKRRTYSNQSPLCERTRFGVPSFRAPNALGPESTSSSSELIQTRPYPFSTTFNYALPNRSILVQNCLYLLGQISNRSPIHNRPAPWANKTSTNILMFTQIKTGNQMFNQTVSNCFDSAGECTR